MTKIYIHFFYILVTKLLLMKLLFIVAYENNY